MRPQLGVGGLLCTVKWRSVLSRKVWHGREADALDKDLTLPRVIGTDSRKLHAKDLQQLLLSEGSACAVCCLHFLAVMYDYITRPDPGMQVLHPTALQITEVSGGGKQRNNRLSHRNSLLALAAHPLPMIRT